MTMRAVLMCHAPIVIPEIAGSRLVQCESSIRGMRATAFRVLSERPDGIVLVSPHMPRYRHSFTIHSEATLAGNFGDFGYDRIRVELPGASEVAHALKKECFDADFPLHFADALPLDHGAMVPLWFLKEQGWSGKTAVMGFPVEAPQREFYECGELIGRTLNLLEREKKQKWVLVASGDMSHRQAPDAPAGFHPRAKEFDRWIIDAVRAHDLKRAEAVDPELRDLAAEDVLDSLGVVRGYFEKNPYHCEVLSYEAPFGVGYLTADFISGKPPQGETRL